MTKLNEIDINLLLQERPMLDQELYQDSGSPPSEIEKQLFFINENSILIQELGVFKKELLQSKNLD
jgi:hypothetical protein